jgi:hypothetical protein
MDRFQITLEGAEDLRARLEALGKDAPRAIVRALNRSLGTIRTSVLRSLAADTGLARKDIEPSVGTVRATFGRQEAHLAVTGRRIPILAFGARQTRRGVTYRSGSGRKLIPSAFLATMRSGHRGVFKRKTSRRLPIAELFGPSLPHAVRNRRIFELLVGPSGETLRKNLEHEIAFLAAQGKAQAGDAA